MTTHWILGPGAIGRLLAHSLAPFAEVALIGRRDLPAQQRLMTPEGEARTQRLSSLTAGQLAVDAPEPPALVHITTKAMSAEAALESVADSLSPITPLVLWQNGFFGAAAYYPGVAGAGVVRDNNRRGLSNR